MVYNPEGYFVYGLPNIFDKGATGNKKTVLFFGAPINRGNFYNKDGVSDITGALIDILNNRWTLKYNSSDPVMLTRFIAENPITIQEAVMRRDSNLYPVADITDCLNKIDGDPRSLDHIQIGKITLFENKPIFEPSFEVTPVREFPHKDNKLEGCIEIHSLPKKDSNNKVFKGRYIAGCDPYDDDSSETLSLGSLFILDLWTDEIVAEYTGRPLFADTFYENCRRLLLLYDAECNYENNKKGLYSYFSRFGCLYLLSDTLEFLKERDPSLKELYGNKAKGTMSTQGFIKKYGRSCLRAYILYPIENIECNEETGEETVTSIPRLYTLKIRAALKELSLFNLEGNFDRHDALVMLMLLREDKLRFMFDKDGNKATQNSNSSGLEDDPFFKKNENKNKKFSN